MKNAEVVHAETVQKLLSEGTPEAPLEAYLKWLQENPLVIAIKSGPRLYGWQQRTLFAIEVPRSDGTPHGTGGYKLWAKKSRATGFGGHPESIDLVAQAGATVLSGIEIVAED